MEELAALVSFTFVATVSPGPNNTVLWASGMRFGFRRTLPHVVGTVIGMGVVIVAVAAGVGTLLDSAPWLEVALKVAGSVYLLAIAYQVATSRTVRRAEIARPMSIWQATAFQCVNPKLVLFVLAAAGTFLERGDDRLAASLMLASVVLPFAGISAAVWAAGGAALARIVARDRTLVAINVGLGVVLAGSIVLLWL